MRDERIPVAVLGATGSVGQRFVQLLAGHPWFRLAEVVASERSAGKRYREATDWRLDADMPDDRGRSTDLKDYDDGSGEPGRLLRPAGRGRRRDRAADGEVRATRSSPTPRTHRMESDVPLLIPEVNPDHVAAIETQRRNRGWSGFIVTNPNCSAIHLVLALKPLHDAFGIDAVLVTTMQAVSGAGYPGVPSLDMIDNVVPFIGDEEEKMTEETQKLLGGFDRTASARPTSSSAPTATAFRCATATPSASPSATSSPASPEEVSPRWSPFRGKPQELELPSAPPQPVIVRPEAEPPPAQPRPRHRARHGVDRRPRPRVPPARHQVRPARPQHHPRRGGRLHPERGVVQGRGVVAVVVAT